MIHIAKICHEANKAYCEMLGDFSQQPWDEAPKWQQESLFKGVQTYIESDRQMTPESMHKSWMREKEEQGWVYGETKNAETKTHPCMVPYSELPEEQRTKDLLFIAIIDAIIYKRTSPAARPFHTNTLPTPPIVISAPPEGDDQ